jgi:hypothetical protein
MPTLYTCSTCLKDFTQKSKQEHHVQSKKCKPSQAVTQLLESSPSLKIETMKDSTGSFRENSLKMNKSLHKDIRQEQGIFFTPKKARDLVFQKLDELHASPTQILEPSFGSGEFLQDLKDNYPEASIVGVELNKELYESVSIPGTTLVNSDFFTIPEAWKFDLIVGNPPYFVTKQKNPECMTGRPNIYVAFLYKCLKQHLVTDGYLAFVLPTSLFNCSYYEPMRKYIAQHCTIQYVEKLDVKYYQTQQDTMMILLQNKPDPTHKYLVNCSSSVYISPSYLSLQKELQGSSSLQQLGFEVKTGEVVWNQVRDGKDPTKLQQSGPKKDKPFPNIGELVDSEGILVIYDTNIVNGTLVVGNIQDKEKKQYIKNFKKKPVNEPTILVTRGHGNAYRFNYVLVKDKEFYAENHVNMILAKTQEAKQKVDALYKALGDPRTCRFIEQFVGNGAISATELATVIPIFLS